jgi:hypothetical protein
LELKRSNNIKLKDGCTIAWGEQAAIIEECKGKFFSPEIKEEYKNFVKENNIVLVFPKKNTQVSFDGSKYHGEIKLNEISDADDEKERLILAINIWKHKPPNIDFYESSLDVSSETYNKTTSLISIVDNNNKHIIHADKQLSEPLFDKLLFKNDISICLLFNEVESC